MKKLIYLLFAMACFSSCEKDELVKQSHQGGTADGNLPKELYATIADARYHICSINLESLSPNIRTFLPIVSHTSP